MNFRSVQPAHDLSYVIQCFWMVDDDSNNTETQKQKIIPDGYPELIFHFDDPYRIRLGTKMNNA